MHIKKTVRKIQDVAKNSGANSTKLISVKKIYVGGWVRQKCGYGCKAHARNFTCPPYSPTPEETKKVLADYGSALLVEFVGLEQKEEQQK